MAVAGLRAGGAAVDKSWGAQRACLSSHGGARGRGGQGGGRRGQGGGRGEQGKGRDRGMGKQGGGEVGKG